eukprot:10005824-Prorocentrum_lima.AAC.1
MVGSCRPRAFPLSAWAATLFTMERPGLSSRQQARAHHRSASNPTGMQVKFLVEALDHNAAIRVDLDVAL